MKSDYDLHLRERKYKVYWRRNAGKKVESVWLGPGVVLEVKSDTIYSIRTRRDVIVMHHDKLKACNARQIPKWIKDYKAREEQESITDETQPLTQNPKPSEKPKQSKAGTGGDAPYLRTRSRSGTSQGQPSSSIRPQASADQGQKRYRAKAKRYQYCVCKTKNPRGFMVQCDTCKDWFHPGCVGETEATIQQMASYHCPDCKLE
ncbi:death-inducer obliterator 1-like [Saccostrea cucullata]|uniref:death-inducer obliterator 1-like n=1 Tax=Saccostrea cuccullata TaxID=36930 RepID=UPI002ED0200F